MMRRLISICAVCALAGAILVPSALAGTARSVTNSRIPIRGYDLVASIGCTGTHSCSAVTDGRNVFSWTGGRWTGPAAIINPDGSISAISCTGGGRAQVCGAVVEHGTRAHFAVRHGHRWIASWLVPKGDAAMAISCPSRGFCFGTYRSRASNAIVFYRHGSWTRPVQTNHPVGRLQCANPKVCVALTTTTSRGVAHSTVVRRIAWAFNGKTWSSRTIAKFDIEMGGDIINERATCAADACAVVEYWNHPIVVRWWNGKAWTTWGSHGDSTWYITNVSCANSFVCYALAQDTTEGNQVDYGQVLAVMSAGSDPSIEPNTPAVLNNDDNTGVTAAGLSCPTESFCGVAMPGGAWLTMNHGWN